MMARVVFLFAGIIWQFSGLALRADTPESFSRAEQPAWVESLEWSDQYSPVIDQHGGGIYYFLIDQQLNVETEQNYYRYIYRIADRKGLRGGSKVLLQYDPSYQQVIIHRLRIYRDGQTIDLMPDQEFRVLERETSLERNVYDGRLDIQALLEDTRIGDIIECAYTIQGFNPVYRGHISESFVLSVTYPAHHVSCRLYFHPSRFLDIDPIFRNKNIRHEEKTQGDLTVLCWDARDVVPYLIEKQVPSWHVQIDFIHIADFKSWADVLGWAKEWYALPADVPAELTERAEMIRGMEDPEAQIMAAISYVQNEIRYVSLSAGLHSHKPYPLDLVMRRRFGDCKDQAIVLATLLNRLGFEAYPALVSTWLRHRLSLWRPSIYGFDHVIVALRMPDKILWLDPTRNHQGGWLNNMYVPSYGKALIVEPTADGLQDVAAADPLSSGIVVAETWKISDWTKPVQLSVKTVFGGYEADWFRSSVAEWGRTQIEQSYLQHYEKLYTGISTVDNMTIDDRHHENHIYINELYEVDDCLVKDESGSGVRYLNIYPTSIRSLLSESETVKRTAPLALDYPKLIVQEHRIVMPEPGKFPVETQAVNNAYFSYSGASRVESNKLTLRYVYQSHADHVPVEAMPAFRQDVDRALQNAQYSISVPASFWVGDPAVKDDLNLMLVFYVVLCVVLSTLAAIGLLCWKSVAPARQGVVDPSLAGIGGWLWLLMIKLFIMVGGSVYVLAEYVSSELWRLSLWRNLTEPDAHAYHPYHQILMLSILGLAILQIFISTTTLILFFSKRKTFPVCMKGVLLLDLMLGAAGVMQLNILDEPIHRDMTRLVSAVFWTIVWFRYLDVSVRVKSTFTGSPDLQQRDLGRAVDSQSV